MRLVISVKSHAFMKTVFSQSKALRVWPVSLTTDLPLPPEAVASQLLNVDPVPKSSVVGKIDEGMTQGLSAHKSTSSVLRHKYTAPSLHHDYLGPGGAAML